MLIRTALIACILGVTAPIRAQDAATVKSADSPLSVSLSISSVPLASAAEQMGKEIGARILIGPETSGLVTLTLEKVTPEQAVKSLAIASGHRWSRIVLPAEKATEVTPEQASALVTAAEALATASASVQVADGPVVKAGAGATSAPKTTVIYLIHTVADPATLRAARESARLQRERAEEEARRQATAASLSQDAGQDPSVVSAYSAIQTLSPNQIAMLAREYLLKTTPDQQQALGEAFGREIERFRNSVDGRR